MKVITGAGPHVCARAEQYADGVHLFDENGDLIVILASPEDIRAVEGGGITVIEQPQPTPADRLEAQVAYTAMMTDTLI